LEEVNGEGIGQHRQIVNFMKGVSRLRPAAARYTVTWDPNVVLCKVRSWVTNSCDLKHLSLKLVSLLALATGQRVQALASIRLSDIVWTNPIQIRLTSCLKTTTVSRSNPILILPYYDDCQLCPAKTLLRYIECTKLLRSEDGLFIGIVKPHKPVGSQTLSRWLTMVLKTAGIDVTKFHAHSFRHSATSKASLVGVNIDTILKRVGWAKDSQTFAKYYNRPFENPSEFAEKVLAIE